MTSDLDPVPGASRDFPSTHWSSLLTLGDRAHPDFQAHLTTLIQRYWKPAFGYLRSTRKMPPEEALDLTQEFFARVMDRELLKHLDPSLGSFRGYLKVALRNFSLQMLRNELVRRPRGGAQLFRIEPGETDWQEAVDPAASPEEAFDRAWAKELLAESTRDLQKSLAASGKPLYFDIFQDYYRDLLDPAAGAGEASQHKRLSEKYGVKPHDVANHLRHAREILRKILKERVVEYLGPGDDPEAELEFLLGG